MREYRLIDADCHVVEPKHIWETWLPKKFQDRAPRLVKDEDGGDAWQLQEGSPPMYIGLVATPGMAYEDIKWTGYSYETVRKGCWDGKARLEDMDLDGVDAEFIYPSQRTMYYFMGNEDRDFHRAGVRAYNDYMREEFCAADPERLFSLAQMPNLGVDECIAEMQRCKEKGARGVIISAWPSGEDDVGPEDERFFAAAAEARMPVSIHINIQRKRAQAGGTPQGVAAIGQMALSGMLAFPPILCELIMGGTFDRVPDLKIVGVETQIGWIPSVLEHLDDFYWRNRAHTGVRIEHLPSHYFHENFLCTFISDRVGIRNRHAIGIGNMAWSTDYPHHGCDWPYSRKVAGEMLDAVSQFERYRICAGNMVDLYDLPQALDPPEGLTHVIKDRTAIVGIAETAFAKSLEGSEKTLACQAILAALEDAGIDASEVDGLSSYTMETTDAVEIAKTIGAGDLTFFGQVGYGGGAGPGCVGHLAMAVATGQCSVGVAWRSRKRGSGVRPWASAMYEQPSAPAAFTRPYGLARPADEIAMLTRRYMYEYGATREHLCNVAMSVRAMANRNPNAMMYERRLTRDDYMNARWISEPLCLFDNCLETDGALACVIVSAERARDCRQTPVLVHAFAQGMPRQSHTMTNYWCEDPLRGPAYTCADRLYRNSDIGPSEIQCAQLYDAFTPLVILSLEGYGFCKRGEGAAFTEQGGLDLGGRLPTNTSGGGLSEAYVHGFNLINEGVRQIRGTSHNPVPDCEATLVTAGEGVPTSALILRRSP